MKHPIKRRVIEMVERQNIEQGDPGWRPVPDPTVLTTAAFMREIANVKELFVARFETTDKSRRRIEKLLDEKLNSIQLQLHERDIRFELAARDREQALNAALAAAKEAVAQQNESNVASNLKSEVAFTKQIDQMQMIVNALPRPPTRN